ncbi:hypothetical protein I302_103029 [Kwoniella bestiolae CBS 10118]|uniref:Uncharacterized protein n=1 Tax=Kwoniella bestiolae CBS 10118 TaxID=1296100 RepID=A0AAJ8M629_9TREE
MGTAGILGFIIRGRRVGCYNHYDSFPDQLGVDIVMFITALRPEERQRMIERLDEITWVDEEFELPSEELVELYTTREYHLNSYEKKDKMDDPEKFERRHELSSRYYKHMNWSQLLRGVQGAPCLALILSGELKHLIDSSDFEDNWLCCEYAYYVDFENQIFEMIVGGEGHWTFDALRDEGRYWGRLIRGRTDPERLMEELRMKERARYEERVARYQERDVREQAEDDDEDEYDDDDHSNDIDPTQTSSIDQSFVETLPDPASADSPTHQDERSPTSSAREGTPSADEHLMQKSGIKVAPVSSDTMDAIGGLKFRALSRSAT